MNVALTQYQSKLICDKHPFPRTLSSFCMTSRYDQGQFDENSILISGFSKCFPTKEFNVDKFDMPRIYLFYQVMT